MPLPPRPVYRHAELARLFNPRTVAVVGATPNVKAVATRTVNNLAPFEGRVFRVNPRYERIGDAPCYPSLAAAPEKVDCAVFCVPRDGIEAALLDGARAGIGGAVVFASGYTETGLTERAAEQARLTAIAREAGIKLIGPNCLGFLNFASLGLVAFASGEMLLQKPRGPGVGIASQSGALGFALGQAQRRGVNVSHILTFGNGADVHIADLIAYLAGDPNCATIACLFEGMPEPMQLLEAGELARQAGKPVVICKIGVGREAATAALSHTGSLAGSTEAYAALFERAGFVVVHEIEKLMETTAFFAKVGRPSAYGVGVMGGSGGGLIAATDAAEKHGVPMPQPDDATKARLQPFLPDFGALRNPCDLTAMLTRDDAIFGNAVEAMLSDARYGAMVLPHTSLSAGSIARSRGIAATGQRLGKPVCISYSGGWLGGPSVTENEQNPHLQTFQSIDSCMTALAAWHKRDQRLARPPRSCPRVAPLDARDQARQLIAASPNATLTEREAKAVLALYGVPVVSERLVRTAAEAQQAAIALGLPVALKVESPDIPHKTEAGVLRLNLKTAADVATAFDGVVANARKVTANITGVLVQPMAPTGVEIMAGARIDPLFGPLLVTGLGGIHVELLKDTALDLAPITPDEALAMLGKLRGARLLDGFRGAASVNRDALAGVLVRLSEFAADHRDLITELDVNPLICAGDKVVAVDALIVKAS
jgi:acyl-CoA synthetase (NDP forming)